MIVEMKKDIFCHKLVSFRQRKSSRFRSVSILIHNVQSLIPKRSRTKNKSLQRLTSPNQTTLYLSFSEPNNTKDQKTQVPKTPKRSNHQHHILS